MLPGTISPLLRCNTFSLAFKCRAFATTLFNKLDEKCVKGRDPAPYFFDEEVQQLLRGLTRRKDEIVFRDRKDGKRREPPQYKLMTDEDLQAALKIANQRAKKVLQMPPVVKERTEINKTLEKEPALQGYDACNYVFTDITFGIKDRDRLITVREPSGQLRLAKWDERQRMNSVYFAIEGRKMSIPNMFTETRLQELVNQEEYIFILDRACIQFEPDDPVYQKIVVDVYNCVHSKKHYDRLRSTRHFGPMAFHLVWNKMMDNLLVDILESGRINEAVSLVQLFYKIHSSVAQEQETFKDAYCDARIIEYYCNHHAVKKDIIIDTLKTCLKEKQAKEELLLNISKAHGVTELDTTTTTRID